MIAPPAFLPRLRRAGLACHLDDLDQRAGCGRRAAQRGRPQRAVAVGLHRDHAGQAEVLVGLAVLHHRDLAAEQLSHKDLAVLADRQVGGAEESTGHELDVPIQRVHAIELAAGAETLIFRAAWQRGDVQVAVAADLDVGRHCLELVRHTDHAVPQLIRVRELLSDLGRLARQHGQSTDLATIRHPQQVVAARVGDHPLLLVPGD